MTNIIPSAGITDLINRRFAALDKPGDVAIFNRKSVLPIDETKDWARFTMPTVLNMDLKDARIGIDQSGTDINLLIPGSDDKLTFDHEGLRYLGHQAGFKVDFIQQLSVSLQAQVINEIISQHRSQPMNFVAGDDRRIIAISPGWREVCSHAEVCQTAFNTLSGFSGITPLLTELKEMESRAMVAKFVTNKTQAVTRKKGDVLAYGIRLYHLPGIEVRVSIYVKRLVCENGMTREEQAFEWTNRLGGRVADQLDYVVMAINDTRQRFDSMISQGRIMAETAVGGDPREALMVRAQAMKIPNRYIPQLISALEAEPGSSEWDMLNALTRFATHSPTLEATWRERIQISAGQWTSDFDTVTARLPRPIAERVGAQIMEDPS